MGSRLFADERDVSADPAMPFMEPIKARKQHVEVLVVEDEHLVALDIKLRVEHMGHLAEVVHTGEEALERASRTAFDLVLMDIKLKGALDGIETARKLKGTADVPVIYLTAYADNQTLDRARVTEPYGYVVKPFQDRELKAAIEIALQRHGADRQRWQQQEVQRFLAEASARLAASLDYRAVALRSTELMVPRYADWCLVSLRQTNGQVPAFSCWRPNSGKTGNGHEKVGQLIEGVQRRGDPQIITQIEDVGALADALGAQHLPTLRGLGARSLICVPLVARSEVLGAMALVVGRRRPRYSVDDLVVAEDFAHRLAMALDNALLYRAGERAIAMRDDVLAIVSHDLRTPLGTILLQAELIALHPEVGNAAASIVRSAQRMNRLIGDLLDASAINAGHLALELNAHVPTEIAHEALDMFRSQAQASGITVIEEVPELSVKIRCDRDRILQVLSNLLGNALKFTPRGGTVTLRVTKTNNRISFEVQDTGAGIPEDQVPYLFDRFWRAQARNTGAGLGLFIVKGILAAHGTSIGVDTKEGVGSRFFFSLPESDS